MNIGTIERTWAKAEDPMYVNFLEKTFPNMLAHVPGGAMFEYTRCMEELVTMAAVAVQAVIDEAIVLRVTYTGYPRELPKYQPVGHVLRKLAKPGGPKSFYVGWADTCLTLGITLPSPLVKPSWLSDDALELEREAFLRKVVELYPVEVITDTPNILTP